MKLYSINYWAASCSLTQTDGAFIYCFFFDFQKTEDKRITYAFKRWIRCTAV